MINRLKMISLIAFICSITWIIYFRALGFDPVNWDHYFDHKEIHQGITISGIAWAFRTSIDGNWVPVTWISHMLCFEIQGISMWIHYTFNLILHCINSCLVLVLLKHFRLNSTKAFLVALLFAVHPLHVESVVWIAERKGLLSSLFYLCSVFFYIKRANNQRFYIYSLLCCVLGLMSKPQVVVLPVALMFIDHYKKLTFGKKISLLDKLPYFLISIAFGILTLYTQINSGAGEFGKSLPLMNRLVNAFRSLWIYIHKTIFPINLAPFYPYPEHLNLNMKYAILILVFVLITIHVIQKRKIRPLIYFGWMFYLIHLLPMLGIIQVGNQALADRYMYLPLLGLLIIIIELQGLIKLRSPRFKTGLRIVIYFYLLFLMIESTLYCSKWTNSETLWNYTIRVTNNNAKAHLLLAKAYASNKKKELALKEYRQALSMSENNYEPYFDMGEIYYELRNYKKSKWCYKQSIRLNPIHAKSYNNLAMIHLKENQINKAKDLLHSSIKLNPNMHEAYFNLAGIYYDEKKYNLALKYFKKSFELNSDLEIARNNILYIQNNHLKKLVQPQS